MTARNKRATALVVLGFIVLQIIITAVKYFQSAYNLDNPLIPHNLITGIRNYSIATISIYLIGVVINVLYIIKEKFFKITMFVSFLILVATMVFSAKIHCYFLNC